jgi:small subunit ribosomal protein S13
LARIAGIDIPRDKKVAYSLRYIYGIGLTQAKAICSEAKVDENIRVKDLKENR